MTFNRTTKQAITRDVYKVCDGEQTKEIVGEYDSKSKWKPEIIFKTLFEACLQKTSLEDICDSNETPSADTIQKRINELEMTQIDHLLNGWIDEQVERLHFHGNTKLTISIDFHQQPYYGDPSPDWILGMKRKKGTNYCICFLLISITTDTIRCPIYIKLVTKTEYSNKVGLLAKTWCQLPKVFDIRRVYLDRWFCDDAVIEFLVDRGLKYVIAAKRVPSVKTSLAEVRACIEQLAALSEVELTDNLALGQWCRKRGLDTFKVKGITLKKQGTRTTLVATFVRVKTHNRDSTKRWTYTLYLYVTNCKVSDRYIVKLYSKRWIIETDIRCIGTFKAITNSTSAQLRFLFFGLAVFFDVLWVVYSTFSTRLRTLSSEAFINPDYFVIKQADSLQFTARRFLRLLGDEILPLVAFRRGDA